MINSLKIIIKCAELFFYLITYLVCANFFLEFRTNMYMVAKNGIKYVDIETVKSMYMMVKHVHDMYMSCHA